MRRINAKAAELQIKCSSNRVPNAIKESKEIRFGEDIGRLGITV